MLANRLQIEKAACGGVALLAHEDADADQFGLVAQHLDEPSMRDENKALVGVPAQAYRLFPPVILANVCCANIAQLYTELIRARERLRHRRGIIRACARQCSYADNCTGNGG